MTQYRKKVSELEDIAIEIVHIEMPREKSSIRRKQCQWPMGQPQATQHTDDGRPWRPGLRGGRIKILEEIFISVPDLMETKLTNRSSSTNPNTYMHMHTKETAPRCIIIKLLKTRNKSSRLNQTCPMQEQGWEWEQTAHWEPCEWQDHTQHL